eukprot:Blabericola_migrator_1__10505@NODE_595_length_7431_cov_88_092070_g435_i1_p1_GENE_NODE_595_length_7431_cov_88_092070_g435_i1NODE_595_length_7431_cov_88_092070_g435_i1_p1_ORF_typecomplete_len1065_score134_27Sec7/PF01369_20/1_8e28_NODE_595_length_7431_cov_88_092070_g435_i141847378
MPHRFPRSSSCLDSAVDSVPIEKGCDEDPKSRRTTKRTSIRRLSVSDWLPPLSHCNDKRTRVMKSSLSVEANEMSEDHAQLDNQDLTEHRNGETKRRTRDRLFKKRSSSFRVDEPTNSKTDINFKTGYRRVFGKRDATPSTPRGNGSRGQRSEVTQRQDDGVHSPVASLRQTVSGTRIFPAPPGRSIKMRWFSKKDAEEHTGTPRRVNTLCERLSERLTDHSPRPKPTLMVDVVEVLTTTTTTPATASVFSPCSSNFSTPPLERSQTQSLLSSENSGAQIDSSTPDPLAEDRWVCESRAEIAENLMRFFRSVLRVAGCKDFSCGTGRHIHHTHLPQPRSLHEQFAELRSTTQECPTGLYRRLRPADFDGLSSDGHPRSISYKVVCSHARRALKTAHGKGYEALQALFEQLNIESLMYQSFFTQEPNIVWRKFTYYYGLRFSKAVELFNSDFKKGLKELLSIHALVANEDGWNSHQSVVSGESAESGKSKPPSVEFQIAYLLAMCPALYRNSVGETLASISLGDIFGNDEDIGKRVLKHYVDIFDFTGQNIEQALRFLTSKFPLQGESQHIYRTLEAFSLSYAICRLEEAFNLLIGNHSDELLRLDVSSLFMAQPLLLSSDDETPGVRASNRLRRLLGKSERHSHYTESTNSRTQGSSIIGRSILESSLSRAHARNSIADFSMSRSVVMKPESPHRPRSKSKNACDTKVPPILEQENSFDLLERHSFFGASGLLLTAGDDTEVDQQSPISFTVLPLMDDVEDDDIYQDADMAPTSDAESVAHPPRRCESETFCSRSTLSEEEVDRILSQIHEEDDDGRYVWFKQKCLLLRRERLTGLEDSILTVAYALIMLHTSQHNCNVQKSAQFTKQSFRQMVLKAIKVPLPISFIDNLYLSLSATPLRTYETDAALFFKNRDMIATSLRFSATRCNPDLDFQIQRRGSSYEATDSTQLLAENGAPIMLLSPQESTSGQGALSGVPSCRRRRSLIHDILQGGAGFPKEAKSIRDVLHYQRRPTRHSIEPPSTRPLDDRPNVKPAWVEPRAAPPALMKTSVRRGRRHLGVPKHG